MWPKQHANFLGSPRYQVQKDKLDLNDEKWEAELGHLSAFGWAFKKLLKTT